MMTAAECRDFAKWYRARACETPSPLLAAEFRTVAGSLSKLATELDAGRSGDEGSGPTDVIVQQPEGDLQGQARRGELCDTLGS